MPKNEIPFQFTNESKEDTHILTLSGVIAKNYWSTDKYIDAVMVRNALDNVTKPIIIRLNSNGGDAFQGIEIYNYLKDHKQKITVEITGWAASAASILAMGADEIVMNTGTSMLIHNGSTGVWGNKEELQKVLAMLETLDSNIIDIYAERTKQSREKIEQWMKDEKTFKTQECIEFGFADRVKERPKDVSNQIDIAALINQTVSQAMERFTAQTAIENKVETPKEPQNEAPKPKSLLNKLRKGE